MITGATFLVASLMYIFFQLNVSLEKEVAESIREKYSMAELQYFMDTAYGNDVEKGHTDRLLKWTGNVKIRLNGDYDKEDSLYAVRVVRELNAIIEPIDLSIVAENPNIEVHFLRQRDFKVVNHRLADMKFAGFSYNRWLRSLRSATIVINKGILERDYRNHLIREELTQCMGLFFDSYTYPKSIFQEDQIYWNLPYDTIDIKLIELLYNDGLPSGLKKSEFRSMLMEY